jgi:hypothetical protein
MLDLKKNLQTQLDLARQERNYKKLIKEGWDVVLPPMPVLPRAEFSVLADE